MTYNATVFTLDAITGEEIGVFVAEVDGSGKILRSNWLQCTGLEGTPSYDTLLRTKGRKLRIVRDGCQGYRARLRGLCLPPGYGK